MSTARVRNEFYLWRAQWQQIDTLRDRVDGARDEDEPFAIRCKALYDAAVVVERLRLRRDGEWMPHPTPMEPGPTSATTIEESFGNRGYELPGALDLEMAVAGLFINDDGEPAVDPPKVELIGSEDLFDVWDAEAQAFVPLVAPRYLFGKLSLGAPQPYQWIPGMFKPQRSTPEMAPGQEDDALFSVPRREEAAKEGIVLLKPWSELRRERWEAIIDDAAQEQLVDGQPDFASLRDLVSSASDASARTLLLRALIMADADAASLAAGIALIEDDDPDDEAITPLRALAALVDTERSALRDARQRLSGTVSGVDRNTALALIDTLPSSLLADATTGALFDQMDAVVDARIAYPDGPLRSLRVLEQALAKTWRSKVAWFSLRRQRVLEPRVNTYLRAFENNLTALVEGRATALPATLVGATVETAVAAGGDKLTLAHGPHDLKRLRAGHIAVLGGARPALAVVLGHRTAAGDRQQLRIAPLLVSLKQGLGLDGIPGLVQAGVPLSATLTRPLTGDELRRGVRAGELEADGIPQQVVALWSRLKLLRGPAFATSLPAPFATELSLPVHATEQEPLAAHAAKLLLPTGPFDATTAPPQPLVATPGEIMLLRGRDADGLWWQGAVECSAAHVTTMEAEQATPEQDPDSPICCESETPIVLVTLSMNTVPAALTDHVTLHRDFRGFGATSLAVGELLPEQIDGDTQNLAAQAVAGGYDFVAADAGDLVDRSPELSAAAMMLERWLGEP